MSETLRARIRRRARSEAQRGLLWALGRQLVCAACGRRLFRGLPIVWRGELKVIGAAEHNVRLAFDSKDSLRFRHLELDQCPSSDRPWVP